MMAQELNLNFLAASAPLPGYTVFRKFRKPDEKIAWKEGLMGARLPKAEITETEWENYIVSFVEKAGFDAFEIREGMSVALTLRAMLNGLSAKCSEMGSALAMRTITDGFVAEAIFPQKIHPEGTEEVILQPYFLALTQQFGFLADFHFRLKKGVPFTRRIQQLSLSLDEKYRRNLDYYADRLAKIQDFTHGTWKNLNSFKLPNSKSLAKFEFSFKELPSEELDPKTYIVGSGSNQKEQRGQFFGVKNCGPWKPIAKCPPLLFMFREQDVEYARKLARALRGKEPRIQFQGFESLFRVPLEISSSPVILKDFSRSEAERALSLAVDKNGPTHIPVLVMPKGQDAYTVHKAIFTHAGVPTQMCSTEVIADDYALGWSVANVALQIFCKAGGQPWKVKPTDEHSLIIGLSQSHKISTIDHRVEKYFAFSILTDSSGLFQSIDVVGEGTDEKSYLQKLRANLSAMLKDKAAHFDKVVLHTSFRLKYAEMQVIQDVVVEAASSSQNCKFAVVKVNQRNRFFAVNKKANSFVPFEGSFMDLGRSEYLLWFEGIFPDNPSVKKAIPGPTHLSFLKVSDEKLIGDRQILQDLVNLSGANWRGFNAKSAPVSVFFCHLVAERLQEFQARNLPLPRIGEIKPWFL